MSGSIYDWIRGFEKEMQVRFGQKIKVVVLAKDIPATMEAITKTVAEVSGISLEELLSKKRGKQKVSDARMVAMYFIKDYTDEYPGLIAKYFSRDRTTCITSLKVIKNRLHTGDKFISGLMLRVSEKLETIYKTNYNEQQIQD